MTLTTDSQLSTDAWDRQPNEPARLYEAFRIYRDLPAVQRDYAKVAERIGEVSERTVRRYADTWSWRDRAAQWDDACHQIEDRERLEAIREMHSTHRRAGRAAVVKALQALSTLDAHDMNASSIARMLELGAKLERNTLLVSVEELQGVEVEDDEVDDPWSRIADELDPHVDTTD